MSHNNNNTYDFMKTGFDSNIQPNDTEFLENISVVVGLFTEKALRNASYYVSHNNSRAGITPEDMKRAMMLEMFLFKNRPNALENAEEMRTLLFENNINNYDTDETNDTDNIKLIDTISEENQFSENICSCAICKCINNIYDRWNKWEPCTVFEIILKQNIDIM